MGLGFWEVAILLVIVLVFFGAGKLPEAMRKLGEGTKAFRAGMQEAEPPPEPSASPSTPALPPALPPAPARLGPPDRPA